MKKNKAFSWVVISRYYETGQVAVSPVMKADPDEKSGSKAFDGGTMYVDVFETRKEAEAERRTLNAELKEMSK